jgi:hypothetical protein
MNPIDPKTLRDDFEATIRGISPTFPLHQSRWAPVDAEEETEGGRLRAFFIVMGYSRDVSDGVYGERETIMEIAVDYSGLPNEDVHSLASEDGTDLLLALENRVDPTVSGFLGIQLLGEFEPQNIQPGAVWGLHRFTVRYLGRTE